MKSGKSLGKGRQERGLSPANSRRLSIYRRIDSPPEKIARKTVPKRLKGQKTSVDGLRTIWVEEKIEGEGE